MKLVVEDIKVDELNSEGYYPLTIQTDRGIIEGRHYLPGEEKAAVIYVGGVGGGFDSPAKGLYAKLCQDLLAHNIGGLRLKYRNPTDLAEAVLDVLAGITYLEGAGVKRIGLVGHSFGGAVVIQAASVSTTVKTVITLATQSYGTEAAAELFEKSMLLIHGEKDEILPPSCSQLVYGLAPEPKHLEHVEGASHSLREKADEVYELVRQWLEERLGAEEA